MQRMLQCLQRGVLFLVIDAIAFVDVRNQQSRGDTGERSVDTGLQYAHPQYGPERQIRTQRGHAAAIKQHHGRQRGSSPD
ncbi:hypothetical protein D3C71_1854910 [compost metagenome]